MAAWWRPGQPLGSFGNFCFFWVRIVYGVLARRGGSYPGGGEVLIFSPVPVMTNAWRGGLMWVLAAPGLVQALKSARLKPTRL
jgi:hypothetical protein